MKRFVHVQFAVRTDVGKKRKNNEDAPGAFPDAGIYCVSDGMGGGDDGEIASAAVVKAVEDVSKLCVPTEDGGYAAADVADELEGGLNKASEWIFNRAAEKKLNGCGATFVGVVLDATRPDSALAVHAGDSRLYLLHGRSIKQITRDHSAAEMIGTKDESKLNPIFRSMVMNAVGIRAKVEPERTPFKVAPGDRILICSDGLSRMVPDKKILSISRQHAAVGEAVDALIAAALDAGGIDNVTVVLVEIGPLPEPAKSLPMAESAVEFNDGDSDTGTTDGTDAETDDSALTVQTVQPMVAQSKLDLDALTVAQDGVRKKGARRRRALIAISVGLFLAVVVAAVFKGIGKSQTPAGVDVVGESESITNSGRAVAPRLPQKEEPILGSAVAPQPRQKVATNESARVVAPPVEVVKAEPLKEVMEKEIAEKKPSAVTNLAVVANATPVTSAVVASLPAPVAVPKEREAAACTNFVASCDASHVAVFIAKVQRQFPDGKRPYDYLEQVRRFERSARECARMRTVKAVQVAAVDLKIMLQTAESAKAALAGRAKTPVERRWQDDWETVATGDPRELSVQEAGARLILSAPEVSAR